MANKTLNSIKGELMRITRLDVCGVPKWGDCAVVTTKGFVKVEWTDELETGAEYSQKNAYGEYIFSEKDPDTTKWLNVKITMGQIDPAVEDIIGGATPAIHNGVTIGAAYDGRGQTEAFAIEVWTKSVGNKVCGGSATGEWGYFVIPLIRNGRVTGSWSIEDGPMSMELSGNGVRSIEWKRGPHGDNPYMLSAGFPNDHLHGHVVTTVRPPAVTDGCALLLEPPNKSAVDPGDVFAAETTIIAQDATNAAKLTGLGYSPASTTAWNTGEFMSIGAFRFHWAGTAWVAGAKP